MINQRRGRQLGAAALIAALIAAQPAPARPAPPGEPDPAVAAASGGLQSDIRRLVDEAHRRALASGRLLAAAPADIGRVAVYAESAWQAGDGLRALTYALVLLLIGGGVEWLYWCYAGRARQAIAEIVFAASAGPPLPPRWAASLSALRALTEICGCLFFAIGTIAAATAFGWPFGVRQAVGGFAVVTAAVRLTDIAVRLLLAPRSPRLRLLPLDDRAARRVRPLAIGIAAAAAAGWWLPALCDEVLAAPALGFAVGAAANAALCGFALGGIRLWSAAAAIGRRGRAQATAAAILPFLAVAATVAGPVSAVLGARRLAFSIMTLFAAILAGIALRGLVDAFTAEPALQAFRPVMRRIALFAVAGAALALLGWQWGLSLQGMSQSAGGFGRLLGRALDITVVVLLADLVWLWAKTTIDRRVAGLAPAISDASPGVPAEPGARAATLLPLLRKAILAVVIAAAGLIALSSLGIDIGPLLAGAGVVGIAIGFGAQALVRDIVSGIFYLLEDAFRIGEYVEFGQLRGTVEGISLRFLRLRHHRGAVHTVPFGEIRWLTNQSRDWQIMKLEFRVPFDADLPLVKKLVREVGDELMRDTELGPWLIEPVKSRGVIRMEEFSMVVGVKFTVRPGDGMFTVRREAYQRILQAFATNGVRFADRHVKVEMLDGDRDAASALAGAAETTIAPTELPALAGQAR